MWKTTMETTEDITKLTVAMKIPYPVVSLSSSKTESAPKEENNMKIAMKAKKAGTILFNLSIYLFPKKQATKPATIDKSAKKVEDQMS
jgi:hypothetical protein